jgi:heme exporter protein CcmD
MLQSLYLIFDIGEYGYFVWPAYGIFLIVIIGLMIESKLSLNKAKKELAALTINKTKQSHDEAIES